MSKKYYVYIHTTPNNKKYIGITSQKPETRWANGFGYTHNKYFNNAIEKYGWNNIKHEIVFENLTKEEASKVEVELIDKYKTCDRNYGYNLTTGGEINKHYSQETIQLMSINNSGSNNPFYGKKHTAETKRHMSEMAKGRIFSEETRKKLSDNMTGRYVGDKNPMYGKTHTDEARLKISETHKGIKPEIAIRNSVKNRSRCVVQLSDEWEFINSYEQIALAAKEMNVSPSAIRGSCKKNGNMRIKGYRWMYIEDYNTHLENIKRSEKEI